MVVLLDAGASPTAVDRNGWTPLHCAAGSWKDREAKVRELVRRGASVLVKTKNNWTPLHYGQ